MYFYNTIILQMTHFFYFFFFLLFCTLTFKRLDTKISFRADAFRILRGFARQSHLRGSTRGLKNVDVQLSSDTARLMEFLRGRLENSRGSCNFRALRAAG